MWLSSGPSVNKTLDSSVYGNVDVSTLQLLHFAAKQLLNILVILYQNSL